MKTQIRTMTLRDYPAVMALWRGTSGIGLDDVTDSRAGVGRYLRRNPRMCFVACEGAAIVGAVLSGHDGRRGYLHHLAVAESHRRYGLGKALVSACLQSLERQHIPKCNIFVLRSNRSGKAFWRHGGWTLRPNIDLLQHGTGGAC